MMITLQVTKIDGGCRTMLKNVDDSIWLKSSIPDQRWENVATNELMKTYWKYLYDSSNFFVNT